MAGKLAAASIEIFPVGSLEIAERLGVKPQTVHMWRHRGILPEPSWTVSGQPAWDWLEVENWARETGRLLDRGLFERLLAMEGCGWDGDLEEIRRGGPVEEI